MNEMFTERARKAIEYARDEAARLKHDYIGTEHLLLGLIRLGEGFGYRGFKKYRYRCQRIEKLHRGDSSAVRWHNADGAVTADSQGQEDPGGFR